MQGRTQGDPWQLGGAVVSARDGETVWRFASRAGGEHPTIAQLREAAGRAVA